MTLAMVNPRKTAGPKSIPGHVIRDCVGELADVQTDILNIPSVLVLKCTISVLLVNVTVTVKKPPKIDCSVNVENLKKVENMRSDTPPVVRPTGFRPVVFSSVL